MSGSDVSGGGVDRQDNSNEIRWGVSFLLLLAGTICIYIGLTNRSNMYKEVTERNDNKKWAASLFGDNSPKLEEIDYTGVWVLVGLGVFLIIAALLFFLLYKREVVVAPATTRSLVPGWYDDPDTPDRLRYWDGDSWTAKTADKARTVNADEGASGGGGVEAVSDTRAPSAVPPERVGPPRVAASQSHATSDGVPRTGDLEEIGAAPDAVEVGPTVEVNPYCERWKWFGIAVAGLLIIGAVFVFLSRTASSNQSLAPSPVGVSSSPALWSVEDFQAFFASLKPNERANICEIFTQDADEGVAFIKAPLNGLGWEPYVIKSVLMPECGLVQGVGSVADPAQLTSTPQATTTEVLPAPSTVNQPLPTAGTLIWPEPTPGAVATEHFESFFKSLTPSERQNICTIYVRDATRASTYINAAVNGPGWPQYVISIILIRECGALSNNSNYTQS